MANATMANATMANETTMTRSMCMAVAIVGPARRAVITLALVSSAAGAGGCKSEAEKAKAADRTAVVAAERQVDEAAKRVGQAAAELGASAAVLGSKGAAAGLEGATAGMAAAAAGLESAAAAMNGAMQGAAGQASGKSPLVDFRALKNLLPETIMDLPRKSAVGEKSAAMGFGMSRAEGHYRARGEGHADDQPRIDVKLTDVGATGAVLGAAAWANVEIDKEKEDGGFERTTTFAGNKALEKYDGKTKHGEINVFVGGRYLVEIDSHDLPPAALRKAAGALDLAKLAALK
jgi:hypothetical protein